MRARGLFGVVSTKVTTPLFFSNLNLGPLLGQAYGSLDPEAWQQDTPASCTQQSFMQVSVELSVAELFAEHEEGRKALAYPT